MPEGKLCNRKLVDNKEFLDVLLADKAGQLYYEEMNQLDVDTAKLWATIQKSFKSRMKTWLEICAHCGLCADSCFFYLANNKDPSNTQKGCPYLFQMDNTSRNDCSRSISTMRYPSSSA